MIIKFNRTFLLIAVLVILIIALVSVYASYYNEQASQQEELEDDLSQANATFIMLASQVSNLESQLDQRNDELEAALEDLDEARERFPESVATDDYDEILFGIAYDCDLEITVVTAPTPEQVTVAGDITYMVTTFNVTLTAIDPAPLATEEFKIYINETILGFVNTIATNEDFDNASIELVNMVGLEPSGYPGATIKLDIYGYQGE